MTKLNDNFIKWACSLSGQDGGNPESDIWASGIEWGYIGDSSDYYAKELPTEIANGAYETKLKEYDWKGSFNYTYGRSLAKLYSAIKGGNVKDYQSIAHDGCKHELFKPIFIL